MLLVAITGLMAAGAIVAVLLAAGVTRPWNLLRIFNMDAESNLPAWFSSAGLLLSGFLLWLLFRSSRPDEFRRHWLLLSLIFVGISADETAVMHETLGRPIREWLHAGGPLYFAWVVPAIPAVAILGVAYWRLVWSLPERIRRLTMVAGAVYLGGALGMEVIGAPYYEAKRFLSFPYVLFVVLEETLEMLGIAIWNYALASYLELRRTVVQFGKRQRELAAAS
jgi:hypothetical protein